MSYNGSGVFNINSAGQPVVGGTVITATAFNALTADIGTGLSTAITKDGQTVVTNNIPLSTFKITLLGDGTAAKDAVNVSQLQSSAVNYVTASGSNTITGTMSPTLTTYTTGNMFWFTVAGTNTTAVTLNIDSLGAKAVTRDGTNALISGDLAVGEVVIVIYDGTRFQCLDVNSGLFTSLTATGDSAFTSTGAVQLSSGTTGQRPAGVAGKLRFNSTTAEFEGYNGTTWASVGGSTITNDTATSTNLYPTFLTATTGTASSIYTSNAKLLYKPSTGALQSTTVVSGNGIFVNSTAVSENQTIFAGTNGGSFGPVTVNGGISVTVESGSVWTVI